MCGNYFELKHAVLQSKNSILVALPTLKLIQNYFLGHIQEFGAF